MNYSGVTTKRKNKDPLQLKVALGILLIGCIALLLAYFFQPLKTGTSPGWNGRYHRVEHWPALPADFQLGNPTGLGIDTSNNLVVFHRADRTWPFLGAFPDSPIDKATVVIIDNKSGKLIESWGSNLFIMPHGLTVDQENNIWISDIGRQQVLKFSHDGKPLMTLGEYKVPGNDSAHFNRPTDLAIANDGTVYISDGYRNSRVVRFSSTGQFLQQWGSRGEDTGQFHIPHAIAIDHVGNVLVADRENNRVEVFDSDGKFRRTYTDPSFGAICSIALDPTDHSVIVVDDLNFLGLKHRGSDVIRLTPDGSILDRLKRTGPENTPPAWFHDLAVDREGSIFVADINQNRLLKFEKFKDKPGVNANSQPAK